MYENSIILALTPIEHQSLIYVSKELSIYSLLLHVDLSLFPEKSHGIKSFASE